MSDKEVNECKYNKFGFCKYREKCTRLHYTETCKNLTACKDIKRCPKRHPKACKIYALEKFCRFGNSCSYQHGGQPESNKESENTKKITALEKSVKEMAEKIKHLEDELAKNKKSTANPTNKICCEECDYRCEKSSTLRKHINTKHRKVKCLECGEGFKSLTYLQMHLNNDHIQKNNQDDKTRKLSGNCPICKKDFKTLYVLCDHFNDIHVEKEEGSECYNDNFQTWMDLFQLDH